jgi:hypothetical protein
MDKQKLINWLAKQAEEFQDDMDESEKNDLEIDYAHAEGAKLAYEFVIKHLIEED